ncbi:mandelate racemase/muconate lactonizing enzyme family protein [Geminicoccus roseus]|uniref:mandelate racemase/muconate lactonizing enzyme family protein n=1 Tax=Geminicoccus roseus TaxID=404900 RepID=UPI00041F5899|nr:mandelate racemase/muconate lactonizing enzyme family protein [Geminicoccus roseus]
MKIKDIHVRAFEKPLDGTARNPRYRWTVKRTLLVLVETENGIVGSGETWVDGGSPGSLTAFIEEDLKPVLLGEDALMPERHFKKALDLTAVSTRRSQTFAAMSAIDIALWDIKGQAAREPLWRMLGGHDPQVLPYASGGLYKNGQSADAFAEEYAAYAKQGFQAVKIKVGGASLAVDLERVAKLRAALGPGPRLMVDAVSNYDVPTAVKFAKAAAPHDIYWFEQPLPVEDIDGLVRIQVQGGIPLCGLENEYGLATFRRLMETDAVHFVQFDPVISGGITHGRKIAAMAEAFFKPVTLHHSNSIVSMMANIHLAAAVPNADSIEYHVFHQPLFDQAPPHTFDLTNGRLTAPEKSGLGIDLSHLIR